MNNNLESQLKKLQEIKLSKTEKHDLKHSIDAHIRSFDVRNELLRRQYMQGSGILAVFTKSKYSMTGIAIGLMLLIGGGTSFAAGGALPGDSLYPVKVEVNERIEGTFAFGAEGKAEWESKRAERRLGEAEKLAVLGRLNADTREEVAERFDAHVQAALENAQKLGAERKEDITSRIHSRLESAFSAHAEVLGNAKSSVNAEARGDVDALVDRIHARANESVQARVKTESEISARGQAGFEASAGRMKEAAKAQIGVLAHLAERNTLEAEEQARATSTVAEAQELVAAGEAHLETEAYGDAYQNFVKAFQLALRTHVLLRSQAEIGISFPPRAGVAIDGDRPERDQGGSEDAGKAEGDRQGRGEPVFCTADAKQCPDGSYVGRSGPDCSFDSCPGSEQPEDTDDSQSSSAEIEAESEIKAESNGGGVRADEGGRVKIQFGF